MRRGPARLALIGLRGAGKSSVAEALAGELGRPRIDLDQLLCELARARGEEGTPGELLERLGEPAFRDLEAEALREATADEGPWVLATGGGAVLRASNRALLARRCACVWLDAAPEVLLERTTRDAALRPALTELAPLQEVRRLAEERRAHYAQLAELRVDVGALDVSGVASVILSELFG